jgi:serine/threonine protein kinase
MRDAMQDTTKAPAESIAVGACVPGTPYRVVGMLGAANAGSVYEVEHVELGKRFALKALPRRAARFDTVGRLKNEWRALARLAHPNIIAVTDAGTTPDGLPFFVMERLEGESLRARLEREGRLRASEAIGIAAGVAAALGAAHRIGVVHRDVKPESIFLARGGRVKLQDFGLARRRSSQRTASPSARRATWRPSRHWARRSITAPTSTRWGWCCSRCWRVRAPSTTPRTRARCCSGAQRARRRRWRRAPPGCQRISMRWSQSCSRAIRQVVRPTRAASPTSCNRSARGCSRR